MTPTSGVEFQRVLTKKLTTISRRFPSGCNYKTGDELVLVNNEGGRKIPYARAKVLSVKEQSVSQARSDDKTCSQEGFSNSRSWWNWWSKTNGKSESGKVYRVHFKVVEIHPEVASLAGDKLREISVG